MSWLWVAFKVGPIDKLSLVFTVLLAVLILGEKLTFKMIGGTILMALGAVLIAF
ncbi:EamA family transporter [Patescibacteria group bacterium]|nr:EamA family transporter [Patescibacteria group bacterium]